ncbi:MAG: class I SAM-dependent methyltransferase [bacterium]|nr:class I SAM-dependent methyltransferase [bacterium]
MDKVKEHFENEAGVFDGIILKLIPFYPVMIKALVAAFPYPRTKAFSVIDLGCGTGTMAKIIKEEFPRSRVTCLDLARNMIDAARVKLKAYPETRYILHDLRNFLFDQKYDAVVSSLALHHLTHTEKKIFMKKIYKALKPGGLFYNADVVLGPDAHLKKLYISKWIDFMKKSVPLSEIQGKWLVKYRKEDIPAPLMDQMEWLASAGFRKREVIWKYYNYALYGGRK